MRDSIKLLPILDKTAIMVHQNFGITDEELDAFNIKMTKVMHDEITSTLSLNNDLPDDMQVPFVSLLENVIDSLNERELSILFLLNLNSLLYKSVVYIRYGKRL